VLAVGLALIVEQCLPPRPRPIHDSGLLLHRPLGLSPSDVHREWSSFPSDHAVMLFALVTGLFLVSRRVGAVEAIYTCVVTAVPRIYLVRNAIAGPVLALSTRSPAIFYAVSFLITLQTGALFIDIPPIARWSITVASALVHGPSAVTAGGP
jgi:hypothetical protein